VARRAALRDAAALEVDQARAALSGAQAAAEGSAGRAAIARARLVAQFPGFALPAQAPEIPLPEIPAGGLMALHDRILGRSHELRAAEALAAQAEAQAERARREKIADPSVGLRVFSEKGGMERGAGVLFSMPLGGGYRSALADKAGAQASAARAAWGKAREAVAAQEAALAKLRRGQQLGEMGLAEVLLGERQAHEALRAEVVARADALRALTRLRIDSHTLWIDDEEEAAPAH
jgi:cobalt-zinc-cadmium efflux system outer membrane protein